MRIISYFGKGGGGLNDLKNLLLGSNKLELQKKFILFTLYRFQDLESIAHGVGFEYIYAIDKKRINIINELYANFIALIFLCKNFSRIYAILILMPHPLDIFIHFLKKLHNNNLSIYTIRHNPPGFIHVKSFLRNKFIVLIDNLNTRRSSRLFFFSKNVLTKFEQDPHFSQKCIFIGFGYNKFGSGVNLNLSLDSPVKLLFFGRILDYKGLDILLDALPLVKSNVKLTIAGVGITESDKIKIEKLGDKVDFFDKWITDNFADHLYSIANAVVLPYRSISQSGPLLSSIGYCVPVIGSNLPGVKEFISHGHNGLIIRSNTAFELARTIDEFCSDDLYKKLKINCINSIEEFSWEMVSKRLFEMID